MKSMTRWVGLVLVLPPVHIRAHATTTIPPRGLMFPHCSKKTENGLLTYRSRLSENMEGMDM